MMKKCIICHKEFEPKTYNRQYCYDPHIIKCRICHKEIDITNNKIARKSYINKGFIYCSHKCSCIGIAQDKINKANSNVNLKELKELIENTSLNYEQIAKELNTTVDFVRDRCKRLNIERPEYLKEQQRLDHNNKIKNIKKEQFKDIEYKNEVLSKMKNTYKEKTGYESNFQNPLEIEKYIKTKKAKNKGKYFNEDTLKNIVTKRYERYDKDELVQRAIKTKIDKYGDAAHSTKGMKTKFKRYGNKYYTNSLAIQATWNSKSKEEKQKIQLKVQKTKQLRYKNPYYNNVKKIRETCLKNYGVDNVFKNSEIKMKIQKTNMDKYGTSYPILLYSKLNNKTISNINKKINERLKFIGCETELEKVIGNYSYDIFTKPNILIEINPTYTHNSTIGPYLAGKNIQAKPKDYHYLKTQNALDNNYKCIHIFDWDNLDKIINSFIPKINIYARKLELKEVSKQQCDSFLNNYHFQNTCNAQTIRLGLYYKDELVQIMTFGKPRYNKNYEWELLRLCTIPKYKVIGGSEKLFKYFLKNYNPISIISYCDNSKFSGNIYKKLGFDLKSNTKYNKHWYNVKTKRHITDNLLRQRGYSQLHKDNNYEIYNKGDSNIELMLKNGYVEIYDCGQSSYIWNK